MGVIVKDDRGFGNVGSLNPTGSPQYKLNHGRDHGGWCGGTDWAGEAGGDYRFASRSAAAGIGTRGGDFRGG